MFSPRKLTGQRIQLHPLELSHAEGLYESAKHQEIWTYLPNKIESLADMIQLLESALSAKELGSEYPFAVYDNELKRFVGSTRLLNISVSNRNLEIGWTWYSPEVWRTRVNTECKYELLKYCFEEFQAVRVQLKADVRNARSNQAIERIGATKEGILRQDRILHDGFIRNSNLYSVINSEWPEVKNRLEHFLKD
ncbi:GNAT family N-acetyltransferase [Paenibacillus agricola]|uniref:GNAT family N-acetyltransferase n=1 Tax=Paenibacillus agricola TaxID=2716264 RepID=A0ABX0JFR7_9BACL|nr:GNAT family N-acetyltransferase [Paenibacillus agricola]NHN35309.1 GNAT family N-acetyltransferase [Paenibacillus agricola]